MAATTDSFRSNLWIWGVAIGAGLLHTLAELAEYLLSARPLGDVTEVIVFWAVVLGLAALATRRRGIYSGWLERTEAERREALRQIEQLDAQNALLQCIAGSTDIAMSLQPLTRRIGQVVPCDRVGLALPKANGQGFETFMARVDEEERRAKPRLDLEFPERGTLIGSVVTSGEPCLVPDMKLVAPDFLDANFLLSSGFRSGIILPLMDRQRAFGAVYATSRREDAFTPADLRALRPIAEVLGVAYVAQQLQIALTRLRTTETMAELTLSAANEINSALQTIVGHCDLLEQQYPDPALQRDLATVVRQAQRIADLLERMRASAATRLKEVAVSPNAPEAPPGPAASRVVGETGADR